MEKRDYIDLIRVAEAIMRLEKVCVTMTGCTFDEGECHEVYYLWDILRRNAATRFHSTDDLDLDSKSYQEFVGILNSEELTAEEKYKRLLA